LQQINVIKKALGCLFVIAWVLKNIHKRSGSVEVKGTFLFLARTLS